MRVIKTDEDWKQACKDFKADADAPPPPLPCGVEWGRCGLAWYDAEDLCELVMIDRAHADECERALKQIEECEKAITEIKAATRGEV